MRIKLLELIYATVNQTFFVYTIYLTALLRVKQQNVGVLQATSICSGCYLARWLEHWNHNVSKAFAISDPQFAWLAKDTSVKDALETAGPFPPFSTINEQEYANSFFRTV